MFAKLMGQPELRADPRFDTHEHRNANRLELIRIVEAWLQSFPSRDEPLAMLQDAHILCAPVLDTEGVMNDQHNLARNFLHEIEQPDAGRFSLPAAPFHFSESPVEIRGRAPRLGEDNVWVLREVLGYPTEKIARMAGEGILFSAAESAEPD